MDRLAIALKFELIFDAEEAGYRCWWFPAFGLIFVALGLAQLIYRWKRASSEPHGWWSRISPHILLAFALFWVVTSFVGTFSEYWELRQALRSGQFKVVEGKVTNFVPMPYHGHANERFTVKGHRYEYSDYGVSAGFNNTRFHGGPIREGLIVRIADVRGKIARLEIIRTSESEAER